MKAAADITADNENFYIRTGLSQPPPDPFGAYTNSIEGHLSAYADGWINEAPLTPNNLSPSGSINETAPVFSGDFRDRNGTYGDTSGTGIDSGDRLNQYHIQVRAVGTTTLLWNTTYAANSAEQSADAFDRAYGGSTLTRGTTYEWRPRTSDEFGAFGDWSSWTAFTPVSLGFVTLDSDLTGTIQSNQPDFKGRWNHQTTADMTRVQVRLLNSTGAVVKTGADYDIANVANSAAPGTLFTVPWADAGLSTLAWGTNYRYQIRGKDASNCSDWSASRTFKTNAAPPNGSITTSYPKIRVGWTDASFRASVVDTTNVHLWVALASNTVSGSDTPSVQAAGFRYSTTVPDTNWVCYTRGSGSGTVTDSKVAVSSGTYVFRMVLDGSSVQFWINGTLVSTHRTNLPTAPTLLAPRVLVTAVTTAAKNMGFGVFMAESK